MRVRFAPSPTGALHIGGARTALYNWLLAKGQGGTFVLRIEDTDRERSTPENVEQILDALQLAEPRLRRGADLPVRASPIAIARRSRSCSTAATPTTRPRPPTTSRRYKERHGCRPRLPRRARVESGAVRLHYPDTGDTVFDDVIRGEIRFPNVSRDDPVIARADGSVLYNFAVAVDDLDAAITHVVRGEDHISNTPTQLLVFEALGANRPRYAHLPLLHGPDGRKLSKRHGAASVQELRAAGYLPEAVDNYIALLGAGFSADEEYFTMDELAERFRLERVSKNPAVFDEQKLRHMNGRYLRELPLDELTARLEQFTGRTGLRGAVEISAREDPDAGRFLAAGRLHLRRARRRPQGVRQGDRPRRRRREPAAPRATRSPGWSRSRSRTSRPRCAQWSRRKAAKPGKVFQPIRVAIAGSTVSPGIFESVTLLGRQETLARIDRALARAG